jgi:probable HAF family extracellular repeat protein
MYSSTSSRCLTGFVIAVLCGCSGTVTTPGSFNPSPAPIQTPFYVVQNLGSLGGTSCCLAGSNNNRGWVDGTSALAGDKSFHPFLWRNGVMKDLGTLGGPNASAGGMNDRGDVTVGGSDTGKPDPLGEDFCAFGTHQTCLSFIWHHGKRTLIPTLGGNNNDVNGIINSGLVLAFAETTVHDPTCVAPQVLGYEAFTWEPDTGKIRRLPPLPGDAVSVAFDMNDRGEAVGYSGACGTSGIDLLLEYHAVMWRNGKPINLGSLGGTFFISAGGINNHGQVGGTSTLPGNTTAHAFLWQNGTMTDLGTLPGDHLSFGGSINDSGQMAIQSCKTLADWLNNTIKCHAAIWQNGVMTGLNALVRPGSSLYLIAANWINNHGAISGTAIDRTTGSLVPFLATPCGLTRGALQVCTQSAQDRPLADQSTERMLREEAGQQLWSHRKFPSLGASFLVSH